MHDFIIIIKKLMIYVIIIIIIIMTMMDLIIIILDVEILGEGPLHKLSEQDLGAKRLSNIQTKKIRIEHFRH